MNPDIVTTSKIVGGFTAKHWVAVITTIFTGVGALLYGGYWAGQRINESQALIQQADLKSINTQIQAKLEATQVQATLATTASAQLREMLSRSQQAVEEKTNEVAKLTEALGRANNCAFVHQQIIDTKKEMGSTGSVIIYDSSPEWQEQQRERKANLEKRLNAYQQQLGTCNK